MKVRLFRSLDLRDYITVAGGDANFAGVYDVHLVVGNLMRCHVTCAPSDGVEYCDHKDGGFFVLYAQGTSSSKRNHLPCA